MSPGASACLSILLTGEELLFYNSVSTFPTQPSPCSSAQIRVSETPPRPTVSPFPISLALPTGGALDRSAPSPPPQTPCTLWAQLFALLMCVPGEGGGGKPPSCRPLSLLSSHLTVELYPSAYESILKISQSLYCSSKIQRDTGTVLKVAQRKAMNVG